MTGFAVAAWVQYRNAMPARMAILDELVAESRKIVAEGGNPTVRLLAERVFLSPSTVQSRIGSMENLELGMARQIGNELLATLGEEQPLVDDELRAAARQRVGSAQISNEEIAFGWDRIAKFEGLVDIRNRVFAFVWPEIDPVHYVQWADHLAAAIEPMIRTSRDPSSPAPHLHAAIRASYTDWLRRDEAVPSQRR